MGEKFASLTKAAETTSGQLIGLAWRSKQQHQLPENILERASKAPPPGAPDHGFPTFRAGPGPWNPGPLC